MLHSHQHGRNIRVVTRLPTALVEVDDRIVGEDVAERGRAVEVDGGVAELLRALQW